jgi:hypothetical protein
MANSLERRLESRSRCVVSNLLNDTDLGTLPISCLVDKIKNAGSSPKPFNTVVERPDAVGFRQPLHEPLNKMIRDPTLIFRGMKELVCQTFRGLDLSQIHKISPPTERAVGFRGSIVADYIRKRLHDGYSLTLSAGCLTTDAASAAKYQS